MTENSKSSDSGKSVSQVPTEINLSPRTTMDLSWLSEEERRELLRDYTRGILDIGRKAQELHVDAAALKRTLDDLSTITREASESGDSVTITHTQSSTVGRTEVIMGNTNQAQRGRLTKSQTGEKDMMPYYIFAGILALVIIVALARG